MQCDSHEQREPQMCAVKPAIMGLVVVVGSLFAD